MEEIDIALIKKKSLSGVLALTSRTFLLQLIAFAATFLLTIFLSPQIFGIFYVVSAIIAFLGYFSDIGLAAALIQKKETLTDEDLTTTFTIQQILVGSVVFVSLIFSESIGNFYHLDIAGLWLLRALIISFFLSSLKTIPSVLLERKLEFNKLVIPQILETLGFYIVAVFLAWRGLGVVSFTWAVLIRASIGLVAIYMISPWRVSFGFSKNVAKKLMKFGVPFQLNSFIALIKDDLLIIFLGTMLPFASIGYIGWAKKWAEAPLRLIMDSVIRVTFPAFSRLQGSKEHLSKAIEITLFGLASAMLPMSVGLLFFVHPLIGIIPKYSQWEPALFSFYLLTFTAILAGFSTPLTNALNAIGKIKVTLGLMIMWTTLTWILTVIGIHFYGFDGVAMALLGVSSTLVIVVFLVKRQVKFSFWKSVEKPIIVSILQGAWYFMILPLVPHQLIWFILVGGAGVILYGGILWAMDRPRIEGLLTNFKS